MKLVFYSQSGNSIFEFNFNQVDIQDKNLFQQLTTTKQILYDKDVPYVLYDPVNTFYFKIDPELQQLTMSQIEDAYKRNQKILILLTQQDIPIIAFYGNSISLKSNTQFVIDNSDIFINNLHWLLLTKKDAA